ncbi:hypothetical protein A9Q98_00270 [Thalassotalea sp. 42_200_T64]|nr:hypothetical protein A9Q98_00270 [Thalassotalea sp. 42_200_T64]
MKKHRALLGIAATVSAGLLGQTAHAVEDKVYSPFVVGENASQVFWGDTHLHTSYSADAGMVGNTLGPEVAYRFALGHEITTSSGQRARLIRPLDFLVISDHAENLGLAPLIANSDAELLKTKYGKILHDLVKDGKGHDAFLLWIKDGMSKNTDLIDNPVMGKSVWESSVDYAEKYNDPGHFTAFIGFEWTSLNTPQVPSNLHRVVIFKDDGDKTKQVMPYSAFDSYDPEDLWTYMERYEQKTGGDVLAIAHNGNLSNGIMFATERLNGEPIDKAYAERRMKWEPIYEVTQIKGDGEAHPLISPNDEFADYGTWDLADIAGLHPKKPEMLPYEYARTALQVGLQQEDKLGVNPFKVGFVGSTDSHTSMVSTREDNYWGKTPRGEAAADRYKHKILGTVEELSTYESDTISSGLAAVWARENTRADLYDAMANKETYATTGTRITVRFFGGWDYQNDDVYQAQMADIGYQKGVPMGSDLSKPTAANKAPVFMVAAMKDPNAANLDRVQIVKGWVDSEGERQERIYDVAVSGGRKIDNDGRCKTPVGDTVNITEATYSNSIGDTELRAVWTDPDFNPALSAVYYVRVLEIPTPTWQAHDQKFYGMTMPDGIPLKHQERAYTSPIWYGE